MSSQGKAWKYGDNIDTDQIISARYLVTSDPVELGKHCLETTDPEFSTKVRPGDIIVGLKNFGCGSSREHAPISIKGAGVAAVIAKSFARIFYRNSINLGLPLFETDSAERIKPGDELELDFATGKIKNLTQDESYQAKGLPPFAREIMEAGGLMLYIAKKRGLTPPKTNAATATPATTVTSATNVTPAQAGVQTGTRTMDSRFRGNDVGTSNK